ncbi:hypothetical protein [Nitrospirillum iridis]|uniref:Uncharacterized protein n=1 Tax=Nitrospirillum iridis TaxID=765888 RepID=A0A7X0AY05_9PROT|nr:hypothetical protein [Nitrospirillum iridis]MBB6250689.1 hypothetical protein [Nitrospirillum iridis]
MRHARLYATPLAAVLMAIAPAGAASAAAANAAADVVACKKITDHDQRLACFDKSSDGLEAEMRKAGESWFGGLFASARPDSTEASFGKREAEPTPAPELDNIKSHIVSMRPDPAGHPVFTLENGQVWRSQENARIHLKGDEVATVSHSMLGMGYQLQVGDMSYSLSVVRER